MTAKEPTAQIYTFVMSSFLFNLDHTIFIVLIVDLNNIILLKLCKELDDYQTLAPMAQSYQ